jgi:hypothetical protein
MGSKMPQKTAQEYCKPASPDLNQRPTAPQLTGIPLRHWHIRLVKSSTTMTKILNRAPSAVCPIPISHQTLAHTGCAIPASHQTLAHTGFISMVDYHNVLDNIMPLTDLQHAQVHAGIIYPRNSNRVYLVQVCVCMVLIDFLFLAHQTKKQRMLP